MLNPEVNRDKDLNVVRSAMNRYFEDNGRGRPALGCDFTESSDPAGAPVADPLHVFDSWDAVQCCAL